MREGFLVLLAGSILIGNPVGGQELPTGRAREGPLPVFLPGQQLRVTLAGTGGYRVEGGVSESDSEALVIQIAESGELSALLVPEIEKISALGDGRNRLGGALMGVAVGAGTWYVTNMVLSSQASPNDPSFFGIYLPAFLVVGGLVGAKIGFGAQWDVVYEREPQG